MKWEEFSNTNEWSIEDPSQIQTDIECPRADSTYKRWNDIKWNINY